MTTRKAWKKEKAKTSQDRKNDSERERGPLEAAQTSRLGARVKRKKKRSKNREETFKSKKLL